MNKIRLWWSLSALILSLALLSGVKRSQQMVFWPPAASLAPHHSAFLRIFVIFPLSVIGPAAPARGSVTCGRVGGRGQGVTALTNPSCHLGWLGLTKRPVAIHKLNRSAPGRESVAGDVSRCAARKSWWEMISHAAVSHGSLLSKFSLPVSASQLSAGKFQSPQNQGRPTGKTPDNNRKTSC